MTRTPYLVTRRTLLAGACAAPAILTFPRGSQAATQLTLGHNAAPGNPRQIAAEKFGDMVKERTSGRYTVRVAGAEQLGNEQSLLTSVRTGVIAMTVNSQGSASALVPELAVLGLPFLFNDAATAFKVLEGKVGTELNERFSKVGMLAVGWWDNGIRNISNSKRPIVEPADLQGLKIRTPPDPMTIDIFQALGAATQQISFGELYIALQQGVVDGQENPLVNMHSSKLYEVQKFISISGHKWEVSPILFSEIVWKTIAKADQDIIMGALKDASVIQRNLQNEQETALFKEYSANPKLAINQCNRPAFQKATEKVVDIWRAKPVGPFVNLLVKEVRG
jgi:tripartite ATP-independent transporter DctP family solute receptor